MIKIFSHMLDTKKYRPMSVSEHSALRLAEDMQEIYFDPDSIVARSRLDISVEYAFTTDLRVPASLRGGRSYGGAIEFASLYEILTEKNMGVPFIDTYFEVLFQSKFENEIRRKSYTLKEAASAGEADLAEGFDELSERIKKHVQQCLATGRIPLNFSASRETVKRRRSLGLTPVRAFFATGQLIDNLIISYTVSEGAE